MSDKSYDYSTRDGVRPISWNDFHGLVKVLAVAVAPWPPEIVLPVGRGGYYPGALLAHILQVEVYPVRLSRRQDDVVVRESPLWLVEPPAAVAGRRVLATARSSAMRRSNQAAAGRRRRAPTSTRLSRRAGGALWPRSGATTTAR